MNHEFLNIISDSPSLVVASAGTGKTYTIIENILSLLQNSFSQTHKEPLQLNEILILSFTEKTVNEMRMRLWKRLKQSIHENPSHEAVSRFQTALLQFDTLPLYTIHSFCKMMIQQIAPFVRGNSEISQNPRLPTYAFLFHFLLKHTTDTSAWNTLWAQWNHAHDLVKGLELLLDKNPRSGSKLFNVEINSLVSTGFLRIFESYREYQENLKLNSGVLTFNDLLWDMYDYMRSNQAALKSVRDQFAYVFIDEAQDTDPVQWKIIESLFLSHQHPVAIIGDPKQSIYRFRGADLDSFISLQSKVLTRFTLDTNYRSTPALTQALNYLLDSPGLQSRFPGFQFNCVNPSPDTSKASLFLLNKEAVPVTFNLVPDLKPIDQLKQTWQQQIISHIQSLLKDHFWQLSNGHREAIRLKDIAILVRTNREARDLQSYLVSHGISALTYKNNLITTSLPFKEWTYILEALSEPGNTSKVSLAAESRPIKFLIPSFFNHREIQDITSQEIMALFTDWHTRINLLGLPSLLHTWIETHELLSYCFTEEHNSSSVLLHQQIMDMIVSLSFRHSLNAVIYIIKNMADQEESSVSGWIPTLSDSIPILTMHNAKGLEFPIVILGGGFQSTRKKSSFSANLVHDARHPSIYMSKHKDLPAKFLQEEEAEEYRLLYVALTRAKHKLIIPLLQTHSAFKSVTSILGSYTSLISDTESFLPHGIEVKPLDSHPSKCADQPDKNLIPDEKLIPLKNISQRPLIQVRDTIRSFSSLHKLSQDSIPDHKEDEPCVKHELGSQPGGALFGTLLHNMLENIDFRDFNHIVVKSAEETQIYLNSHFELQSRLLPIPESWRDTAISLVKNCLTTPFTSDHQRVTLSNVNLIRKEMEFHIKTHDLPTLFMPGGLSSMKSNVLSCDHITFSSSYIHGFIDVVFEMNGKIYFGDYKSNHLGEERGDYSLKNLQQAVTASGYDLQMLIYSACAEKYFHAFYGPDFYENKFGGFYFFFLRGMDPFVSGSGTIHYCANQMLMNDFKSGWTK